MKIKIKEDQRIKIKLTIIRVQLRSISAIRENIYIYISIPFRVRIETNQNKKAQRERDRERHTHIAHINIFLTISAENNHQSNHTKLIPLNLLWEIPMGCCQSHDLEKEKNIEDKIHGSCNMLEKMSSLGDDDGVICSLNWLFLWIFRGECCYDEWQW